MVISDSISSLLLFLLLLANCLQSPESAVQRGHAGSKPPVVKGLSWTFYEGSCPELESIVRKHLRQVFKQDTMLAASLPRIHFHDCFVQLDGSASGPSEQQAPPNLSLRPEAFKVIDDLRALAQDSQVVTCTDIATPAARDAVYLVYDFVL